MTKKSTQQPKAQAPIVLSSAGGDPMSIDTEFTGTPVNSAPKPPE